ncbi:hypothetical protein BOTBODRAFT_36770 [Botryobasidium botryosum FD-172 SS1]|uniref:Uncharacterized protein n=1 Tax=Botryobasidium botryosum (strain FD-172 SS1) TaxID=930990 RepID=A0A067M1Z3_BOTB1|nr:hypothetical protein BOTBODRAFT_36770 [Botryobasidium botryosum FD-172 SS1]
MMGYDDGARRFLLSNCEIPITINCDNRQSAIAQIALMDESGIILLIVQINNPHTNAGAAETRAIASAVAAAQNNSKIRGEPGLPALSEMTIPCIGIIGTQPYFYKVPVMDMLSRCIAAGTGIPTQVLKCPVITGSWSISEGMENAEFRFKALQYYESFKKSAEQCWSDMLGRGQQPAALQLA